MTKLILIILLFFSLNSYIYAKDKISTEKLIANTLYYEAANQSFYGKVAIASVIWNRADGNPAKFQSIIFERKQFSCWNKGAKRPKIVIGESYTHCQQIAKAMCNGTFSVPIPLRKANSYHEQSIKPSWGKAKWLIVKIGTHIFYHVPA